MPKLIALMELFKFQYNSLKQGVIIKNVIYPYYLLSKCLK